MSAYSWKLADGYHNNWGAVLMTVRAKVRKLHNMIESYGSSLVHCSQTVADETGGPEWKVAADMV